jgi:hypothetical protein
MEPTLIIMAAGMGSRYGGLKQIDPVGPSGEIVLDYSVYDALEAGFGKVVFVIRKDIEDEFKKAVAGKYEGRIEVEYAIQELGDIPEEFAVPADRKKPWGTGHAIRACRDAVSEPFAVINADDFYGRESFELLCGALAEADPESTASCMVGFKIMNTLSPNGPVTRGVCREENGFLQHIAEREKIERADGTVRCLVDGEWKRLSGEETVSMNMWGFTPWLFGELESRLEAFLRERGAELKSEFLIPTIVDELIRERKTSVRVLHSSEQWYGVTYPEDKPTVQRGILELVDAGRYPASLWS